MNKKPVLLALLVASALLASHTSRAQEGAVYSLGDFNSYSLSLGTTYRFNLGYVHSYLGLNIKPLNTGEWQLGTDGANNGGSMITGGLTGVMRFMTIPTANAGAPQIFNDGQLYNNTRLTIYPSGLVQIPGQTQIGSQQPLSSHPDSKLSVDGKLVAKSIYVTTQGWADFVFEPGYRSMSLPALESYLQKNKHLPHIPSAQEVESNGINVADMNAKLLQTVEELTLHVIALSKQVTALEASKAAEGRSK